VVEIILFLKERMIISITNPVFPRMSFRFGNGKSPQDGLAGFMACKDVAA
jgi:hypothetical protein